MDIPRDPRRAGLPFSRVTLFNSSEADSHCIRPTFPASHAAAGAAQTRRRDDPTKTSRISSSERSPERFFPGTTTLKPLRPIIIEGVPSVVQAGGHYE